MKTLFIGLFSLLSTVSQAADLSCPWRMEPLRSLGVSDQGAEYYWYNTKLKNNLGFTISAPRLPVVGYYSIVAYVNGELLGKLFDYEIVPEEGINPIAAPGSLGKAPMGTPSRYTVTIGGPKRSLNHIDLPASAIGKQIEIALRYYRPLVLRALPTIESVNAQTGSPVACPPHESYYLDGGLIEQALPPMKGISGEVMNFVRVKGQGIYPDADSYLTGATPVGGIALIALEAPRFPTCVGFGCYLDRQDKPAYSSLVVASGKTTFSTDTLSDREMKPESSSGVIFIAAVADGLVGDLAGPFLEKNGFTVMKAPRESGLYVYRQKMAPENYADSFVKAPVYPIKAPAKPSDYFAAKFIASAPIGIFCQNRPLYLADCILDAKTRLLALRLCYEQVRRGERESCD